MDLEKFYDEYADKVYKFFYIKSLNRQLAEDLTSATFLQFVEQTRKVDIQDFKKYLYGIMRNKWLEFLREKYRANLTSYEEMEDFTAYADQTVLEYEAAEEPINRLLPYIKKLPARQQAVFTMRLIEEKTVGQTARELGKDKNYVKTTYGRAIRNLRILLTNPQTGETELQP